jgi:hypothetical protein
MKKIIMTLFFVGSFAHADFSSIKAAVEESKKGNDYPMIDVCDPSTLASNFVYEIVFPFDSALVKANLSFPSDRTDKVSVVVNEVSTKITNKLMTGRTQTLFDIDSVQVHKKSAEQINRMFFGLDVTITMDGVEYQLVSTRGTQSLGALYFMEPEEIISTNQDGSIGAHACMTSVMVKGFDKKNMAFFPTSMALIDKKTGGQYGGSLAKILFPLMSETAIAISMSNQ